MPNQNFGGTVNNTSGYSGSWPASSANFVYTDGYGVPAARTALDGSAPIYIGSIYAAYTSGPYTGAQMYYQGVLTGGGTVFGASGGTMQVRFTFFNGGTLYFGRNTTNGHTTIANRSGGSGFTGGLVGSFDWGQVATAPSALVVTPGAAPGQLRVDFTGSSDNGGLTITSYTIQYATSLAGPWTTAASTTTGTNNQITLPAMVPYYIRVYANNAAGASQAVTSSGALLPFGGGGDRYNGSAFIPLTLGRRFNGSTWIDLTVRKRFDGVNWITIT